MKARDLFRNSIIRSVAIIYGVFMVILLATSLTSGDGLPEEFAVRPFELPDVYGGEDVVLTGADGVPAVLYFFASW
jgi:hypothetical protein